MHEGKHGILDDVDDMDKLFGTDEEKADSNKKHKHEHGHGHCHCNEEEKNEKSDK